MGLFYQNPACWYCSIAGYYIFHTSVLVIMYTNYCFNTNKTNISDVATGEDNEHLRQTDPTTPASRILPSLANLSLHTNLASGKMAACHHRPTPSITHKHCYRPLLELWIACLLLFSDNINYTLLRNYWSLFIGYP